MSLLKKHFLKVISVTIAIMVFVSAYDIGTPFWEQYIFKTEIVEDVNLNVSYDENFIVTNVPQVVDVKIRGSEAQVSKIVNDSSNLEANIHLNLDMEDQNVFDPEEIKFSVSDGIDITPLMEPFDLEVSQKESKSIAINPKLMSENEENGNIISDYTFSTNSVRLQGSKKKVDSVSKVEIPLNISNLDFVDKKANLKVEPIAYDSKGKEVNDIVFEPAFVGVELISNDNFIELPISYSIVNNQSDKFVSKICKVSEKCISKNVVKVYGDLSEIEKLNNVKYEIDLSEDKKEYNAIPIIPEGVFVLEETEHLVTVDLEQGASKKIDQVPISVNNLSDNFQAKTVENKSALIDVEVTGAKSIIDNLSADDLSVSIDLSNISQAGNYEVPIIVSGNGLVEYNLESSTLKVEVVEVE